MSAFVAWLLPTISASAGTASPTSSLYNGYQYASPYVQPGSFARVNDTLYYVGSRYDFGRELWRVENLGSHSGTAAIVRDIRPGLTSSEVAEITAMGSHVFFSANNGTGRELWMSDGSWEGTAIVAEMSVAPNAGSSPRALTVLNGRVLFWARSDDRKVSLWASDGTEEGTQLLKEAGSEDIDSADFAPGSLAVESGQIFFTVATLTAGRELWKTNGTRAGTAQVKDIRPGPASSGAAVIATSGQGHVYVQADDGIHGTELWRSDGTADGTLMITDLAPGAASFQVEKVTVQGGSLFFTGTSPMHDRAIWRTDGTAAGTVLLHDFDPSGNGPQISAMAAITGHLLVTFSTPAWQGQLWSIHPTNGTPTKLLDLSQNPGSRVLSDLTTTPSGSMAFFKHTQGNQEQIWSYNGQGAPAVAHTAAAGKPVRLGGTFNESLFYTTGFSLRILNPNSTIGDVDQLVHAKASPRFLRNLGENVFFGAANETLGRELHYLFSQSGYVFAQLFKDIEPGAGSSHPEPLIEFNGSMYFLATTSDAGRELWKTDGTYNGTVLVKDVRPGKDSSEITGMVSFGGRLYFSACDAGGDVELWQSDGTAEGTVPYANLNAAGSSHPSQLTVMKGALYFVADDGTHQAALWSTAGMASDITRIGTAEHVRELTLRNPVAGAALLPESPVLYFTGNAALGGDEGLYRTDGTSSGTLKIPHAGSIAPSQIRQLTLMDDRLVFLAGPAGNAGIWTTDGVKTSKAGITVRADDASVLIRAGDAVYFQGVNTGKTGAPIGKHGIWRTNKTASLTVQVQADDETIPGTARLLAAFEETLFFSTPLPFSNESTLWSTQGHAETTLPVKGVRLADSGENFSITRFKDRLLFPGVNDSEGEEIFSLFLSPHLEVLEIMEDGREVIYDSYPSMNWPLMKAGTSSTRKIRIRNIGYRAQSGLSLALIGISTGSGFSVTPSSILSIPPGGWVDAKITFAPPTVDYYYANVLIKEIASGYEFATIEQNAQVWRPDFGFGVRTPPLSVLALENSPVKLRPEIFASPFIVWSWKQGIKEVGKTKDLIFPSVKASQAGLYSLTVKDNSVYNYSYSFDPVTLAVVSRAPASLVFKPGQALTLTCRVASSSMEALSYQWFRNGLPLSNINRVTGSRSATLTVEDGQESDTAEYSCLVTLTVTEDTEEGTLEERVMTLNHGTTLVTVTDKPQVQPTSLPELFVGETVDLQIPATYAPTKYAAKGLPAGLVLNATTGRITGRPTAAKGIDKKTGQLLPYSVTFTVTNAAGNSAAVTLPWLVKPLMPASVYDGLIGRTQTGLQPGLGSRVQLTTTATGTLSGQLTHDGKVYRFTKILDTLSEPGATPALTAWIDVQRGKGISPVQLELQPEGNGAGVFLHDGATTLTGAIYRPAYSKTSPATDYDGPYTAVLKPQTTGENIPAGRGFITATVALSGDIKWTGRLADGTALTGAGFLAQRSSLSLPVYVPLYKNLGSLHGWMDVSAPTASPGGVLPLTTGTLSWVKYPALGTSKDRVYKSGIPLHNLGITGSLYVPPAKTEMLFAAPQIENNFEITLAGAGLGTGITRDFTLALLGKLTLPAVADRPPLKSLSLVVAKGTFTGQLSFTDPNPDIPAKPHVRTVACQGVLLTAQQQGAGYLLLPQLPVNEPVKTSLKTSPILSGDVRIQGPEQNP